MTPIVEMRDLDVRFGPVRAVDGVSFAIQPGETLALVGESGSGKSTTARAIVGLAPIASGVIRFEGRDTRTLRGDDAQAFRRSTAIVFQDPYSSLNPRMTVRDIVAEPIVVHRLARRLAEIDRRVAMLLARVELDPNLRHRYPHEFSGGQRQRIAIARALATDPRLLICDEPTSALDVSTRAGIIELLAVLQRERRLAILYISHDLATVERIAHRVAVMYLGHLFEEGAVAGAISQPRHPYTQALCSAIPRATADARDRTDRITLEGDPPSPRHPPSGCSFHPRCPLRQQLGAAEAERCRTELPVIRPLASGQRVACHHVTD